MKRVVYLFLISVLLVSCFDEEKITLPEPGEASPHIVDKWEMETFFFDGKARMDGLTGRFDAHATNPQGNYITIKSDQSMKVQFHPLEIEFVIYIGPIPLTRTVTLETELIKEGKWYKEGDQLQVHSVNGEMMTNFEIERLETDRLVIIPTNPEMFIEDDFPIEIRIEDIWISFKR